MCLLLIFLCCCSGAAHGLDLGGGSREELQEKQNTHWSLLSDYLKMYDTRNTNYQVCRCSFACVCLCVCVSVCFAVFFKKNVHSFRLLQYHRYVADRILSTDTQIKLPSWLVLQLRVCFTYLLVCVCCYKSALIHCCRCCCCTHPLL